MPAPAVKDLKTMTVKQKEILGLAIGLVTAIGITVFVIGALTLRWVTSGEARVWAEEMRTSAVRETIDLDEARELVADFEKKRIIRLRSCDPNQTVVDEATWREDFVPVKRRRGLVLMLARVCGAEGHGYDMSVTTTGGRPVANFDGARFIGYGLD